MKKLWKLLDGNKTLIGLIAYLILLVCPVTAWPAWITFGLELISVTFAGVGGAHKAVKGIKYLKTANVARRIINIFKHKEAIMSKENGLLYDQTVKDLAKWGDNLKEFKNFAVETVDGVAYKIGINQFNDRVLSKVNKEVYQEPANRMVTEVINGEYNAAQDTAAEILSNAVNTPFVNGSEEEDALYEVLVKTAVDGITNLIEWLKNRKTA